MLKYNHYLKELGIKETDYPFGDEDEKEIDSRYEEDEEGFTSSEFWSLDFTLACYIYSHLCYFRDNCLVGYPAYMTFEQWSDIINKMIIAFRLYITDEEKPDRLLTSETEYKKLSKNRQKKMNYGMKLFIKYFGHLWY